MNRSGSCSQFGARAISEFGFVRGLRQLKIRLNECRAAAEQLMQSAHEAGEEGEDKEGATSPAADWCTFSSGCIPTEGSCSGGAGSARGVGGCIGPGCGVDSCF